MHKLTVEEMGRLDVGAFKAADKLPVVVVLDSVRSLHNVGSALRTADAFRVERVVLCGITGCPPSAEIHKTALGAEDSVDWQYCPDAAQAVRQLRADSYDVWAVEQVAGSVKLDALAAHLSPGKPCALVFGNEVKGVSQAACDACDHALEIPQYGTKHSLNVSVSVGIVLWEFSRLLRQKSE